MCPKVYLFAIEFDGGFKPVCISGWCHSIVPRARQYVCVLATTHAFKCVAGISWINVFNLSLNHGWNNLNREVKMKRVDQARSHKYHQGPFLLMVYFLKLLLRIQLQTQFINSFLLFFSCFVTLIPIQCHRRFFF